MTPRSFFLIFIKILGIYLILSSITVLPQFFSTFYYLSLDGSSYAIINIVLTIGAMLLTVLLYFLILYYCVFRTDVIVDKLRLDKGFTEGKFDLNISHSKVLNIAIIVIGGIMIVGSLPDFSRQIYIYVQQRGLHIKEVPVISWLIFYFIKIIIGYLLIANNKQIVNFIERRSSDKE